MRPALKESATAMFNDLAAVSRAIFTDRANKATLLSALFILLASCSERVPISGVQSIPSVERSLPTGRLSVDSNELSGGLLYVARPIVGQVDVYSYPKGEKVDSLDAPAEPWSVCADFKGNVWITMYGQIAKYAHGGSEPIVTLDDSGYFAYSCAVDAKTGDLAVINSSSDTSAFGNLLVFRGGSGSPSIYDAPQFVGYRGCAYDRSGNLYMIGSSSGGTIVAAELKAKETRVKAITLSHTPQGQADIRWDGRHIAISSPPEEAIFRFSFSRGSGDVAGSTTLHDFQDVAQIAFPIARVSKARVVTQVIGPDTEHGATRFWRYPTGGVRVKQIPGNDEAAVGSAVSFPAP